MSEQKRYTAQEMREIEQLINCDDSDRDLFVCNNTKSRFEMEHIFDYNEEATLKVKAMIRQAADAEDENTKLRETVNSDSASMAGKDAVIAQLKERLEAVVRECEDIRVRCDKQMMFCHSIYKESILAKKSVANAILRAARGEGGAE